MSPLAFLLIKLCLNVHRLGDCLFAYKVGIPPNLIVKNKNIHFSDVRALHFIIYVSFYFLDTAQ